MAFYRKQKLRGKWYPRSFTMGKYDTKDVAERLSRMSTVTKGDTYAVLMGLGEVLGDMLSEGCTVRIEGLGTFYLTGDASGQGVDSPEEVSAKQFRGVRVRLIPEYQRGFNRKVEKRTLVPRRVEWTELETEHGKV